MPCACVFLQLGAASERGGYFHGGKHLDRAISLSRGDERTVQYTARRLVYEKGNMGVCSIHTRMNIGGYIITAGTFKMPTSYQ